MPQNNSKVVFITGASRGIGQAVAYEFATAGNRLILTYHQNKSGGEATVQNCKELGAGKISLLRLDLASDASISEAGRQAVEQFGKIDILINSAGEMVRSPIEEFSFGQISQQLNVNLGGLIKLTKTLLPIINECVVNIGSNLAYHGKANLSVYVATKFALRGFTQSLAKEVPRLKVYCVHPGLTATDMGGGKGVAPSRVAEIIYRTATGQYHLASGSDVLVRYYLRSPFIRRLLQVRDFFKSRQPR